MKKFRRGETREINEEVEEHIDDIAVRFAQLIMMFRKVKRGESISVSLGSLVGNNDPVMSISGAGYRVPLRVHEARNIAAFIEEHPPPDAIRGEMDQIVRILLASCDEAEAMFGKETAGSA